MYCTWRQTSHSAILFILHSQAGQCAGQEGRATSRDMAGASSSITTQGQRKRVSGHQTSDGNEKPYIYMLFLFDSYVQGMLHSRMLILFRCINLEGYGSAFLRCGWLPVCVVNPTNTTAPHAQSSSRICMPSRGFNLASLTWVSTNGHPPAPTQQPKLLQQTHFMLNL